MVGTSGQIDAPFQARPQQASVADIYRFEPVLGVALGVLAVPVIAVAGVVISILSRRSPFIAHLRVGTGGSPLWMWKLRTMWPESRLPGSSWRLVERIAGAEIPGNDALTPDPRIRHWFPAFCRRHSIDELPQLMHVVRGQMSLVGPRPITRGELDKYYGPEAKEVLRLRPGMTGLWQVNGRSSLTYRERLRMDLELVRNFSATLYFTLLLRTIPKLFSGAGAR